MNKTIILSMIRKMYPDVDFITIDVIKGKTKFKNPNGELIEKEMVGSEHLPALAEGYEMKEIREITINLKTKEVKLIGDKTVTI